MENSRKVVFGCFKGKQKELLVKSPHRPQNQTHTEGVLCAPLTSDLSVELPALTLYDSA